MKKIVIVSLLIIMFIFTACKDSTDGATTLENPFIGGTEGILISFSENSPPAEVYAGGDNPFDVLVQLKNEGEAAIKKEDITITLSGINANEFGKNEQDLIANPPDDLEAKRKENGKVIESNPVHTEFIGLNRKEDFSGNTYTIRADVCYKYETDAVSKICIRSNNLDVKEGVCTVTEEKEIYNSGAPIQIADFSENARAKNKVAFTFTVAHKGNGQVYQPESHCGIESRRTYEGKIWIEVSTGMEEGLECTGLRDGTAYSGYTTIYSGEKKITCTQTVDTNSDYDKTVEIKMVYDYNDNTETQVKVKSSGIS